MDSRAESVDAKNIESPRNRDTANEELSTMTEYLTELNDNCAVETELDDPDVSVSFEKKHLPIATCGHDDGGKSTTTTRIGCHFRARA